MSFIVLLNGTFVKTKSIKDSVLSGTLVAVLIICISWNSMKIDFSSKIVIKLLIINVEISG